MATVTGIEKKGPVIICYTDDPKDRVYKLDFAKAKIYGITGRPIKSTCSIMGNIPNTFYGNPLYAALAAFDIECYSQDFAYYNVVESLLSYPDLVPNRIDMFMVSNIIERHNGKIPKGFIPWCRENSREFNLSSLNDFFTAQAYQQWPKTLVDFLEKFSNGAKFNLVAETRGDKDLCIALVHIINNSLKRYEIADLILYLQKIIVILRTRPDLRPCLDDTKTAEIAHKILDDKINEERNHKILANEAKISALNGTVVDEFIIKIPSTMEDFIDEGTQQHNCVGYHYHDAMAIGDALIYFLRYADTPDKSYVTCRYSPYNKRTVEHRLAYNNWYTNDPLFEKIDAMIQSVLS